MMYEQGKPTTKRLRYIFFSYFKFIKIVKHKDQNLKNKIKILTTPLIWKTNTLFFYAFH